MEAHPKYIVIEGLVSQWLGIKLTAKESWSFDETHIHTVSHDMVLPRGIVAGCSMVQVLDLFQNLALR